MCKSSKQKDKDTTNQQPLHFSLSSFRCFCQTNWYMYRWRLEYVIPPTVCLKRRENPDVDFGLESYEDLTTSQIITSLQALRTIGPNINLSRIGNYLPSNPPPNNIILSANVLKALLLILLLKFICQVHYKKFEI